MSFVPSGQYAWNLHALPSIVVGLLTLALALIVSLRQRVSPVALRFAAMVGFVSIWLLGFGIMSFAKEPDVALLWGRIGLAAVCMLPASVYDFTITALRRNSRKRMVSRLLWLAGIGFVLTSIQTELLIEGARRFDWGYYPRAGVLAPLFLVYFFSILAIHLYEYRKEYLATPPGLRRTRIRSLAVAFCLVYLATLDFLTMFGVGWYPIGFLPVSAFLIYAASSIRSHRLVQITAAGAADEIIETMADALIVVDSGGRIRVVNRAAASLLGLREEEVLGRPIELISTGDKEEELSLLVREGSVRDHETQFQSAGGDAIDVSVSISQVVRGENEPSGAVLIARDIRARKAAQREMQEFNRRLQQSNRDLEEFAYVASHDLQEPLRKIQAFGDRLRRSFGAELPEPALDYLARMIQASERMERLIQDLLELSRVTTRGRRFEPTDLEKLVDGVIEDLDLRIRETGAVIDVGELPTIEADPSQIRQLITNLLSNALKFHEPERSPKITIRSEMVRDDRAIASCLLEIRDEGIGFEPEYAGKIFTAFQRLHGRAAFPGSGIGLAICRRIAQRHGGEVTASSKLGEGATFIVRLPVTQSRGSSHES